MFIDLSHQLGVELITGRMRDRKLMTAPCGGEREAIRNRHWKGFRVPRPCQEHPLLCAAEPFAYRQHISEGLTRVVHRRLQIYYRNIRIFCECIEYGISALVLPIFQFCERAYADCRNISAEDANEFRNVLGPV